MSGAKGNIQSEQGRSKTPGPFFSVVVCTYNRATILRRCLESLLALTPNQGDYEIIVVDNNSTPETRAVVDGLAKQAPGLRYVREQRQGLSHARNRAIEEARGTYLAYLDDECLAPSDWLIKAERLCREQDPHIMGGLCFPWYLDGTRPKWFIDEYATSYLIKHGMRPSSGSNIRAAGGHMFIRRDVFERIGGFDPRLGMNGRRTGYGEESELQLRLRRLLPDARILLEPQLSLSQLARPSRMRLSSAFRDYFIRGSSSQRLFSFYKASKGRALIDLGLGVIDVVFDVARAPFFRSRELFPFWQNFIYEIVCRRRAFHLGVCFHRLVS